MIIVNTHPYQTYLFKNSNIMIKFPNCPHPQCWQIDSNYLTCVIWYDVTSALGTVVGQVLDQVGSANNSTAGVVYWCNTIPPMTPWCSPEPAPGFSDQESQEPWGEQSASLLHIPSWSDTGASGIIRHRCRTYYQTLFFTKTYLKFLETEKSNFGDF